MDWDNIEAILISETHWDRAWYLPFQQFRLKLLELIDSLLDLLENNADFKHFTFDGQTVVLEDYLEVKPNQFKRLKEMVENNKITIGPWYVLPDVFLVSGEALIRNLLMGKRIAERFGKVMDVGYIPDPFGHVSQLPQILSQFGYDSVIFARGTGDEIEELGSEFIWESTDGSEVYAHWLPLSYGNIANLPDDVDDAVSVIEETIKQLRPWSRVGLFLLMNGSDHTFPQPHVPEVIKAYNQTHEKKIVMATLPDFIRKVREKHKELKRYKGEFRRSKYQNLLSGVYSSRIYLKQANEYSQRLLERFVEPWSAIAHILGSPFPIEELQMAWKYLLKNHPHDDICGCSIDEVHDDMLQRFRWVEEISAPLLDKAQNRIACLCRNEKPGVIVFNPLPHMRSGVATFEIAVSDLRFSRLADVRLHDPSLIPTDALHAVKNESHIAFVCSHGFEPEPTSIREITTTKGKLTEFEFDFTGLLMLFPQIIDALRHLPTVYRIRVNSENEVVETWARKYDAQDAMSGSMVLRDDTGKTIPVQVLDYESRKDPKSHLIADHEEYVRVAINASDVKGLGIKRYDIELSQDTVEYELEDAVKVISLSKNNLLENSLVRIIVAPDGTISVHDKRTDEYYTGLLEFEDSEDIGDEYDYCPAHEHASIRSSRETVVTVEEGYQGPLIGSLLISGELELPAAAKSDFVSRSDEAIPCGFTTEVMLHAGSPIIHVKTEFENLARDHRLRVRFPTDTNSDTCYADSAFDVIERPIRPLPDHEYKQPVAPTYPLRSFVSLSSEKRGLSIVTHGLLEFEILEENGNTIALTLLRSVGWLSRISMKTRKEAAGPVLETPGGQCLGNHIFEYAIIPHGGHWLDTSSHVEVERYLLPMSAIFMPASEETTSKKYDFGFVNIQPSSLKLSAMKISENGECIVIRIWNISDTTEECTLQFGIPVKNACGARSDESIDDRVKVTLHENSIVKVDIPSKRIMTLLVYQ